MKNLFTATQITFTQDQITRVEERIQPALSQFKLKFEREFTTRSNGLVTMYISGKVPAGFTYELRDHLKSELLNSVTYGTVKVDAQFYPKP